MKNIFYNWVSAVANAFSVKVAVQLIMAGCAAVLGRWALRKRGRTQLAIAIAKGYCYPLSIVLQLSQEVDSTDVWMEYELLRLEQIIKRDLDPAVVTMIKEINSTKKGVKQLFGSECVAKIDLCNGWFERITNWRFRQFQYAKMRMWCLGVQQSWRDVIESMKLCKKDKCLINSIMKDACNARGVNWLTDFDKMLS